MAIQTTLNSCSPYIRSVLRIMAGLLFLQHGTAKYLGLPAMQQFANVSPTSLSGIAGLFELIGGALLVIGLFTRPVAFLCSGLMAVAYFMVHAPKSFYPIVNGGELAVLYCFVFLFFTFAGPGPLSVDGARGKA